MNKFPNAQNTNISTLLPQAETALSTRDFSAFVSAFDKVWTDIGENPDFSRFPQEAELLHLAGEFLIHFGKAYNLINYQSRGKDLLTQAIDMFNLQGKPEKALNSQVVLAFAYFQEGAKEEYALFLLDAESQFKGDKYDHNYLKLELNLLIYELEIGKLMKAHKRISENLYLFQRTDNLKIKADFFNEAGITFRRLKIYDRAYQLLEEALYLAREINNQQYESLICNNLANTYRSDKKYEEALEYADRAIDLAENQDGWRAVFLDTKALIYADQEDYENAEGAINQAIALFRAGDDFGGLCEALWNKGEIMLKVELREMALQNFIECYQIASERIGGNSPASYLDKILDLILIIPHGNLFEKVDSVKKQLIEKALLESNGKITEAARILGIEHQTLSAMMKNFPALYDDLGIQRRTRSAAKAVVG
jgi:tetratricopeptide (TPR) repeat protein